MSLRDLDLWALHAVNGHAGQSYLLDQAIFFFSESNLVKTIPFVVCILVLWFRPQCTRQQREILVATIVSVILALAIVRGLSSALPYVARPYRAADIGFQMPLTPPGVNKNLNDWSSFPSDHATFFFAIATGFWFISRWLGLLFGLLSVFIAWQRVYLGLHYPSDLLAGALIGIVIAIALNLPSVRTAIAAPILRLRDWMPTLFNVLFFLTMFEMGVLFNEVRQVLKGAHIVLEHYELF